MYLIPLRRHVLAIAATTSTLLSVISLPSIAADASSAAPFPGLELVPSTNIGALYRRPDLDMSDYSAILIAEPAVEFSKNWNPKNYSGFRLSAAQVKKIRVDVAELAKSVFTKVLSDGGYKVVTAVADGVLEIKPNILELYITAPDTKTPGRSRTYVMNAGSMTLALQVSDAVTGTLLAVAYDKKSMNYGTLQWSTSVSNRAASTSILTGWANQLKTELDATRAK